MSFILEAFTRLCIYDNFKLFVALSHARVDKNNTEIRGETSQQENVPGNSRIASKF